ncbi:MAG: hypothetical protein D6786_06770 [Gammaproteobacteria bacterium]|nr:MAG: hypothetical protein D6786_06770 [Gammaproteobacteria bacterium]
MEPMAGKDGGWAIAPGRRERTRKCGHCSARLWHGLVLSALFALLPLPAPAVEIGGVQPAALDQPQIYALLEHPDGSLYTDGSGLGFAIQGFLDTGASGVLLSDTFDNGVFTLPGTADTFGVGRLPATGGGLVLFEDVGIGGSTSFNVSESLSVHLAPFHPGTDLGPLSSAGDPPPADYSQSSGLIHAQIGPLNPGLALANVDVFGMPVMTGKVTVMDPRPVNAFVSGGFPDTMRTWLYDPGTAFDASQADSNPGIPATSHHVQLSYASFDRFTRVVPPGDTGPTLAHNPFIGPNPLSAIDPGLPADPTPAVGVDFNGLQGSGSFLLDTGAAATMISSDLAALLHVRYVPGTEGTATPQLETFDPANPGAAGTLLAQQFTLDVGGIGGTTTAAGFYLDGLSLPTLEGDPLNFTGAPVLVTDITLLDPVTSDQLTLDGILGMNLLVASVFLNPGPLPSFGAMNEGAFNWLVFDEPNGLLGLDLVTTVPLPESLPLLLMALVLVFGIARTGTGRPGSGT